MPFRKATVLLNMFVLFALIGRCQNISVYFKTNDYQLNTEAKRVIDSLSKINNIEKISLQGHCDSIGNDIFNDTLSSKRVNSVKKYFLSRKIPEQIIEIKALGKRVSLNKNANDHERAVNRRLEIKIVFKKVSIPTHNDTAGQIIKKPIASDEVEVTINGVVINEQKQPVVAVFLLVIKTEQKLKQLQVTMMVSIA